ncbi:Coq4 family protein [uncultured Erythrobacter sp.]|uniref:Coq4 family protein n=1 Tax=uncultured Erythrobacter sp. TaxID=263913 RepID=UPI002639C9A1|nr:Coq4 family protein [uncultured Erythrobacter sp.]
MAQSVKAEKLGAREALRDVGSSSFLLRDAGGDEGGTLGPDVITRKSADGVDYFPIIHPERKRSEFQFAKAWDHFHKFRKDKEQTDEIIAVLDALPWRGMAQAASGFLSTPRGREIFQTEPYLPDFLDDHETLRKTPKGSFAHAYCDFMEREGLTAAGMVYASDEARKEDVRRFDDGVDWYNDRLRDFHDILHIVTGYGRDLLGEQCIFAYMYHQRPSPGHLLTAWLGTLMMKSHVKTNAPIIGALLEARRNGKNCPRIVEQPIQELFAFPLEEVRARFNTPEPEVYHRVLDVYRVEGIDPHAFMSKEAA